MGKVRAIESAFSYVLDNPSSYLMNNELGGGALLDIGCYCVNVSRMLTASEPSEVYAMQDLDGTEVDITLAGVMKFPGGVISSFHVSMMEERRFYYRVTGDKGFIEVPWAFISSAKKTVIMVQQNEKMKKREFEAVNEYALEFEHFAEAVMKNTPPQYDLEDSLKNAAILEALRLSAQKGQPFEIT